MASVVMLHINLTKYVALEYFQICAVLFDRVREGRHEQHGPLDN